MNDQNDNFVKHSDELESERTAHHDVDLTTFLQTQFENDYKQARTSELVQMSKSELSDLIYKLENRESELVKVSKRCQICRYQTETAAVDNETDSDMCSDYDSSCNSDSSFNSSDGDDDFQRTLENLQCLHEELLQENMRLKKL